MIDKKDIWCAILYYCFQNNIEIKYWNVEYIGVYCQYQDLILSKWKLDIPQPNLDDLLQNTTQEQVDSVKKMLTDYQIDQRMKADPLYNLVKNIIIPIPPPGASNSELLNKINELEARIQQLEAKSSQ